MRKLSMLRGSRRRDVGERTVDAERVDGVDELLVHLDGPHDARLLRVAALPIAIAAARPLQQTRGNQFTSATELSPQPWQRLTDT